MKSFALVILSAGSLFCAEPKKCISPDDNIKLNWLACDKMMQDVIYEMDMHWSFRLAIAEKTGTLEKELKLAPRTLGDGLPYPEHYMKRAESVKPAQAKAQAKFEAFQLELSKKYDWPKFGVVVDPETGKVCW